MIYNISKNDMSCGWDELIPNYVTWGCRIIYYSGMVDVDVHGSTFCYDRSFNTRKNGSKKSLKSVVDKQSRMFLLQRCKPTVDTILM